MTKQLLKEKVNQIISSDTSGNYKRDEIMKLFDDFSHPQPAEVSAEAETFMRKRGFLTSSNFTFHTVKTLMSDFSLSHSPPPVRHMSDEEIKETAKLHYNSHSIAKGMRLHRDIILSQLGQQKEEMGAFIIRPERQKQNKNEAEIKVQFVLDGTHKTRPYTIMELVSIDEERIIENEETCTCSLNESNPSCTGDCQRFENSKITSYTISPPPVRHMSDDALSVIVDKFLMIWEDKSATKQDCIEYLIDAFRSFIQSQQPKQGLEAKPKMSAEELFDDTGALCEDYAKGDRLISKSDFLKALNKYASQSQQPNCNIVDIGPRPDIKDYFPEGTTVEQVHTQYIQSPNLFKYAQALDNYIDSIQSQHSEQELNFTRNQMRQMLIDYVSKSTTGASNGAFKKTLIRQATIWFDEKYPEKNSINEQTKKL